MLLGFPWLEQKEGELIVSFLLLNLSVTITYIIVRMWA